MDGIEIKGIEQLNENEKFELNKLVEAYKDKLKRKTKSEYSLKLTLKKYTKGREDTKDARARYSIQAMIKGETHSFEASAEDWDFNRTVHKTFEKIINEIEHAYHSSEQKATSLRQKRE
jgi:hypothetical protein